MHIQIKRHSRCSANITEIETTWHSDLGKESEIMLFVWQKLTSKHLYIKQIHLRYHSRSSSLVIHSTRNLVWKDVLRWLVNKKTRFDSASSSLSLSLFSIFARKLFQRRFFPAPRAKNVMMAEFSIFFSSLPGFKTPKPGHSHPYSDSFLVMSKDVSGMVTIGMRWDDFLCCQSIRAWQFSILPLLIGSSEIMTIFFTVQILSPLVFPVFARKMNENVQSRRIAIFSTFFLRFLPLPARSLLALLRIIHEVF